MLEACTSSVPKMGASVELLLILIPVKTLICIYGPVLLCSYKFRVTLGVLSF